MESFMRQYYLMAEWSNNSEMLRLPPLDYGMWGTLGRLKQFGTFEHSQCYRRKTPLWTVFIPKGKIAAKARNLKLSSVSGKREILLCNPFLQERVD